MMNNSLEQLLDFLKTLKSPAVNFFLTVLLMIFAPSDLKWLSVFPAALFLGWFYTYAQNTAMEMTLYKRYQKKILNLSQEERLLLKNVKDQKFYPSRDDDERKMKTYLMLRHLESLGLLESRAQTAVGSKWYEFYINPLIEMAYRKILQDESAQHGWHWPKAAE